MLVEAQSLKYTSLESKPAHPVLNYTTSPLETAALSCPNKCHLHLTVLAMWPGMTYGKGLPIASGRKSGDCPFTRH